MVVSGIPIEIIEVEKVAKDNRIVHLEMKETKMDPHSEEQSRT